MNRALDIITISVLSLIAAVGCIEILGIFIQDILQANILLSSAIIASITLVIAITVLSVMLTQRQSFFQSSSLIFGIFFMMMAFILLFNLGVSAWPSVMVKSLLGCVLIALFFEHRIRGVQSVLKHIKS